MNTPSKRLSQVPVKRAGDSVHDTVQPFTLDLAGLDRVTEAYWSAYGTGDEIKAAIAAYVSDPVACSKALHHHEHLWKHAHLYKIIETPSGKYKGRPALIDGYYYSTTDFTKAPKGNPKVLCMVLRSRGEGLLNSDGDSRTYWSGEGCEKQNPYEDLTTFIPFTI